MRLTFIAGNLACGGAQRAMLLLAECLERRGEQITILTLESPSLDFFQVPPGVRRRSADLGLRFSFSPSVLLGLPGRLRRLRRQVRATESDVVVAVEHRIAAILLVATLGASDPVVIWEHGVLRPLRYRLVVPPLQRLLYRRARFVVSVSEGLDRRFAWMPSNRRRVIHNLVVRRCGQGSSQEGGETPDPDRRWIVSMGRLHSVKGYDLLLRCWALVGPSLPEWQLLVIGDGEERPALEALRRELDLGTSVVFVGRIADPFRLLGRSEAYVASSRAEGFPMALLEAMACGLPVLAFDCPTGPREIVAHGCNGLLVAAEDIQALAAAIRDVAVDDDLRRRLAAGAAATLRHYDEARIIDEWQVLLALAGSARRRSSNA